MPDLGKARWRGTQTGAMLRAWPTFAPAGSSKPSPAFLSTTTSNCSTHRESLLLDEGVRVVGKARTGVGVLQLLEEQPVTAVVVDLRLPDLDGIEVARRVAEIARRKTAVIIYTSYADERDGP